MLLYTRTHARTHALIDAHTHTCMHARTDTCMHAHTHKHIQTRFHSWMFAYTLICVHVQPPWLIMYANVSASGFRCMNAWIRGRERNKDRRDEWCH